VNNVFAPSFSGTTEETLGVGTLAFTATGNFHDLRRDGDIAMYKNYSPWFDNEMKNEVVLRGAPFNFTSGVDYFVRSMSALATGIPSQTSLIIIPSASNESDVATPNIPDQTDPNAVANLDAWVRAGGWLVVHAGDNDVAGEDYIVPGLSGPADETPSCTGLTLAVADHALIRGPDATLGTADDLTDSNIDLAGPCFDNHGSLDGVLPANAEVLIGEQHGAQRDVYATYTLGLGRVIVTTQTIDWPPNPTQNLINHLYWAINGVNAGPAAAPAPVVDVALEAAEGGAAVTVNSDGTQRN